MPSADKKVPTSKKHPGVSKTTSTGTDKQVLADLTRRYCVVIGKNAESIFEIASILFDAKMKVADRETRLYWLKTVAKMSEPTANKYQQIQTCVWLRDTKVFRQLPPNWTIWYLLTQCKTKVQFNEALSFVSANAPSYKELDDYIHGLLNKKPKKRLFREDTLVTNDLEISKKVKEITAKAKAEAKAAKTEAAKAKEEAKAAKAEIKALKKPMASAKSMKRDDEPTPEQIREEQEFDYDDGDNLVRVETFKAKYTEVQKKKLQRKEVQKKIAEVLHSQGLHHVEAIIRDRQPMAGKVAA